MSQDKHGQCRTCGGSGNVMSRFPVFPLEWFGCPACKGQGARHQFGPALLRASAAEGVGE